MQINKKLILIVVATLCSLCSTSYALQESLALMFAVTAARSLIATPPYIEVTSTDPVLLRGANALSLSDTQCMHTATPEEQVCFGNNLPTRIGLLPAAPLNIGFLHGATSQIEYHLLPTFVTDPVFPDIDTLSELNPAFAIATEIQQSAERQQEIIDTARQRQQTFSSPFSPHCYNHSYNHSYNKSYYKSHDKGYDKRLDGQVEQDIEANGQDFEWWSLGEPESGMDDSDMATVRYDDIILIEPGSRYWFCSNVNDESQTHNQAVTDGESGSEDDPSSDEDSENESEDEDNPDSGVETTYTYTDPLPVSKEVDASASMPKKLKIKCDFGDDKPDPEKMVVKLEAGSTVCEARYPVSRTCKIKVVGKDGQECPCGKIRGDLQALSNHQKSYHNRQ